MELPLHLIIIYFVGGLTGLIFGAEALVRGSTSLAFKLGITPLVVGLTVVAFGTSSPELLVCLNAALNGEGGISIGNAIGSNIANVGLILGTAALIHPVKLRSEVIRREIPVMLAVTGLLLLVISDNELSRLDGILLMAGIVTYLFYSYYFARKKKQEGVVIKPAPEAARAKRPTWLSIVYMIAGLAFLAFGSDYFLRSATAIAFELNVPPAAIGLSVVSIGTSLPELVTSVVASLKKAGDLAVGNVIGSNIFNILAIVGITALVSPFGTGELSLLDIGIMVGFSIILWPLSYTGFKLSRWEGGFMVLCYSVYFYSLLK